MKKSILFFLFTFSFTHFGHAITGSCLDKISFNEKWEQLSDIQVQCMENSSDFGLSVGVLCADDGTISDSYGKFLAYRTKIDEAFARFQAATNPGDRALANAELWDLKQAQSTYAVAFGIYGALDSMNRVKYNCEQ